MAIQFRGLRKLDGLISELEHEVQVATVDVVHAPTKPRKILTLIMVTQPGKILLGMKKRGFGAGKWNGFGGKLEPGESILQACQRELEEESGIVAIDPIQVGVLLFEFEGDDVQLEVHVFHASQYVGEPVETEEMVPQWFAFDLIPYAHMWPDDELWLPLLLDGQKFYGEFLFRGHTVIVNHAIRSTIPSHFLQ
jgi:8-oxo-dGTP pyrophosphatase MutT (NUDIX family)